jgi:adenylate kinase
MAKRIKTVLLFGPPGSGKGTQGKLLGVLPGFVHLACGEVFRSLDLSSDVGKVFLKHSSRGELVPDDVTARLWRDHLSKLVRMGSFKPETDTLVLDGIPRNVHQAKMLDDDIEVLKLVVLRCTKNRQEIVRRQRGNHSPAAADLR